MNINKAIISGKVSGVTAIKTYNDIDSCVVSVETEIVYPSKSGRRREVDIHHVVVSGKKALYCQRLKKGLMVTVEGKFRPSTNEVVAENIQWDRMVGQEII